MVRLAPKNPKDRFEVYRFFNGLSEEAKEGVDRRRTRVPLVKTFLMEHVASHNGGQPKKPREIFESLGGRVRLLDDTFMGVVFSVTDPETKRHVETTTGFVEQYDERFFAYYTSEDAAQAKRRVAHWIQHPDLDSTWYSSPLLQALWDRDVSRRGDYRFGKLVFRHDSVFEMPEDFASVNADEDYDDEGDAQPPEDRFEIERRKA